MTSVNGYLCPAIYCLFMGNELDSLRGALRQVIDHEVGMNIIDLGLVYRLEKTTTGVRIEMTMTSPDCEDSDCIIAETREVLARMLPPWSIVDVRLVWEPAWSPWFMSIEARTYFGWI